MTCWFRKIRFSLKALMVVVLCAAVVSYGVFWVVQKGRVRAAKLRYEAAQAALEAGVVLPTDVAQASSEWLAAGLAVPFANQRFALAQHVHRLAELISTREQSFANTNYGDGGKQQRGFIERIRREHYQPSLAQLRVASGSAYADHVDGQLQNEDPFSRQFLSP